jgi:hypothetical protein
MAGRIEGRNSQLNTALKINATRQIGQHAVDQMPEKTRAKTDGYQMFL